MRRPGLPARFRPQWDDARRCPHPGSASGRRCALARQSWEGGANVSPDRSHHDHRPFRDTRDTRRDERGITTAEYAVGTAAGAGLAGLLYKMLTGGFGDALLTRLFDHVLSLLGIG